jgi:hypothetical protein
MPDIIVVLNPSYRCNHRLGSDAIVKDRIETKHDQRVVGDHRQEGIFIASGSGIASKSEELENLKIEDVAPTILYLLDAEIPSDMDGRLIEDAVEPTMLKEQPPKYKKVKSEEVDISEQVKLTPEQEEAIMNRLRDLGYVE